MCVCVCVCVATAQRPYTVATLKYEENTINIIFFIYDKTFENIVYFIL